MSAREVIAITGSSGFLGRHLVKHLESIGREVVPVDKSTGYDVLDPESLTVLPSFGTLVHLAAMTYIPDSYLDTAEVYRTNVMGTVHALELCKKFEADFVFPSTYVYGKPDYLPVNEAHPVRAWNPYATSKIMGEQLCASYANTFSVKACVLRLFNLFGDGQAANFLMPTIVKGLKQGSLALQNSKPKRDYTYVADAVQAITLCIDSMPERIETYNVGSGTSHGVREIVDTIQKILGTSVKVEYLDESRPDEIMDIVADSSKIATALGWNATFDLRSGLEDWLKQK